MEEHGDIQLTYKRITWLAQESALGPFDSNRSLRVNCSITSSLNLHLNSMREFYDKEAPYIHAVTAGKAVWIRVLDYVAVEEQKTKKKPAPNAAERWAGLGAEAWLVLIDHLLWNN